MALKECKGCDQRLEAILDNGYCLDCSELRDDFAKAALIGLLSGGHANTPDRAYHVADGMMERRHE